MRFLISIIILLFAAEPGTLAENDIDFSYGFLKGSYEHENRSCFVHFDQFIEFYNKNQV